MSNKETKPTLFDTPIQQKRHESAVSIWENPADSKDAMFQHSIFCQTYLPYRDPGNDVILHEHEQGRASLAIQCTQIRNPKTGEYEYIGLPFGSRARLILAYINTMAIKHQSPIVDIESSITAFTKAIGLQHKGRDIKNVKNQLSRIAASLITLQYIPEGEEKTIQANFSLVKSYDLWFPKGENQKVSWTSQVELTSDYYEELCKRAIPLDIRALGALKNSPMAIDLYSWLAQRLHRVPEGGQFIPWTAIKRQFGGNYKTMKKFKEKFRLTLQQVKLQYRDAKIVEDKNKGFNLYTSPSPIPKKTMILLE